MTFHSQFVSKLKQMFWENQMFMCRNWKKTSEKYNFESNL